MLTSTLYLDSSILVVGAEDVVKRLMNVEIILLNSSSSISLSNEDLSPLFLPVLI